MKMFLSTKGMSIVEILVVIGILSILSVGASLLMTRSIRINDVIWEQLITQSDSRKVIHEIVNELRKAEESSIGSYPIATAESNALIFYANIDADSARERLHYWIEGTTLYRGIVQPVGNPLSYAGEEDVTEIAHSIYNATTGNPLFIYYDEGFTGVEDPLTDPIAVADVRAIRIQLDLERDPDKSPVPLHVESLVSVRSVKSN